jgi:hypothetical protein
VTGFASRTRDGNARRLSRLAVFAVVVSACSAPTPSPSPTSNVDVTGILFVGVEESVQTGPLARRLANAFSDAMELAEANGDDLGYPWVDPATDELVLSAVTPRGRDLIEAAGITVTHRIRDVAHGAAELRRIQDDATFLNAQGVAGAELIYLTIPDFRDNRALIVISSMSRPLLDYLAEHYPADALAIQIDPEGVGARPAPS